MSIHLFSSPSLLVPDLYDPCRKSIACRMCLNKVTKKTRNVCLLPKWGNSEVLTLWKQAAVSPCVCVCVCACARIVCVCVRVCVCLCEVGGQTIEEIMQSKPYCVKHVTLNSTRRPRYNCCIRMSASGRLSLSVTSYYSPIHWHLTEMNDNQQEAEKQSPPCTLVGYEKCQTTYDIPTNGWTDKCYKRQNICSFKTEKNIEIR